MAENLVERDQVAANFAGPGLDIGLGDLLRAVELVREGLGVCWEPNDRQYVDLRRSLTGQNRP